MVMAKTIILMVGFLKAALLMVYPMALEDLSCLMVIIIKDRSSMAGLMVLVLTKLIIPHTKETLRIMLGMEKANKKVKDTIFQANTNMAKRNQAFTSIMEMYTKENLLMDYSMAKENSHQAKDNIMEISRMDNSMDMDNLNGQMEVLIEAIIIEVSDRDMDSISTVKIRVYQGECGRKECSMERVST